jgi:hypothetical protein
MVMWAFGWIARIVEMRGAIYATRTLVTGVVIETYIRMFHVYTISMP